MSLSQTSGSELLDALIDGERSAARLTEQHFERIDARDDHLNAFVTRLEDRAMDRAREADQTLADGDALGPLHGLPIGIKDLSEMAGVRTTYGSKPFADNVATTDAILVERLEAAGAVVLGKTNACEFGHRGTTDNELFGPTSTPFDLDRNAGGSSGGSAAAVADGLAAVSLGGDGGGSIRIPAACCGVFGFNPSFGRVPHEVRPDAFNEHTPFVRRGPLARTVRDAALIMEVIGGPDERDPFSVPSADVEYLQAVDRSISGMSVAYSPDLGCFPVMPGVRAVVDAGVSALADAGADIVEIDPEFEYSLREIYEAWLTTWKAMYAGLVEGIREDGLDLMGEHRSALTPRFAELVEAGLELTIPELKRANRVRTSIRDSLTAVFQEHDILATATLTRPPVKNTTDTIGPARVQDTYVGSPIGWCLTYPFNLVENPAASVPAGLDDQGLPVGMQLVGRRYDDEAVLAASAAVERNRPWMHLYPE